MKQRKYILIDCCHAYYELAYEYCKILKKNDDYFSLNITTNEKQFDVKSVTKEEFEEETNNLIMKWKLTYYVGFKAVESWVLNSQSLAYWKKHDLLTTGRYENGKFKVEQI